MRSKFGGSLVAELPVEVLEPALKRGMGGLRDLDMALWLARARFDTSDFSELAQLGYEPSDAEGVPTLQLTGEMVERFMSDYYRHARAVQQARDRIIGRAKRRQGGPKPPVKWLDAGLVECGGRVGLAQPDQVLVEPALAFRVYADAVARDMAVLSDTRDAIVNATADSQFCERLRSTTEAAELFVALVCQSCRPFCQ